VAAVDAATMIAADVVVEEAKTTPVPPRHQDMDYAVHLVTMQAFTCNVQVMIPASCHSCIVSCKSDAARE
jgi:hypothetical protein